MADAPIERLPKDIVKKKEPEVIEIDADKPVVKKKSLKKSQHQKETVFAKTQTENLQPAVIKHQSNRSFRPT